MPDLRAALNDSSVIELYLPPDRVYSLGGTELRVHGRSVRIWSEGSGATIDGEHLSRLLTVEFGELELFNVHLTRGAASYATPSCSAPSRILYGGGGVLACSATVRLTNVSIVECIVTEAGLASAIATSTAHVTGNMSVLEGAGAAAYNCTLFFDLVTFDRCGMRMRGEVQNTSASVCLRGGALGLSVVRLNATRCTFTDCGGDLDVVLPPYETNGQNPFAVEGGAMYSSDCHLTVADSSFVRCFARVYTDPVALARGGGIVTENTGMRTSALEGWGSLTGSYDDLRLESVTLVECHTDTTGRSQGGAILFDGLGGGTVSAYGVIMRSSYAFSKNAITASGGAVTLLGGTGLFTNTHVEDCWVWSQGVARGGGFDLTIDLLTSQTFQPLALTLTDSTITNCSCATNNTFPTVGAFRFGAFGGGIAALVQGTNPIQLVRTVISSCGVSAPLPDQSRGGGIYLVAGIATMREGSLLLNNRAVHGASVWVTSGTATYSLPAPAVRGASDRTNVSPSAPCRLHLAPYAWAPIICHAAVTCTRPCVLPNRRFLTCALPNAS